jgi:hypothetical protein
LLSARLVFSVAVRTVGGRFLDAFGFAVEPNESYENGDFDQGKAVSKIDLTDDGILDTVIDESDFARRQSHSTVAAVAARSTPSWTTKSGHSKPRAGG